MIFSNPSTFAIPGWISFLAVLAGALSYTYYAQIVLNTNNPFPSLHSFKFHPTNQNQCQTPMSPSSSPSPVNDGLNALEYMGDRDIDSDAVEISQDYREHQHLPAPADHHSYYQPTTSSYIYDQQYNNAY